MNQYSDVLSVDRGDPGFKAVRQFHSGKLKPSPQLMRDIEAVMAGNTDVVKKLTPEARKAILALAALRSKNTGGYTSPLHRIRTIYGLPEGENTEASW